RNLFIQPKPGWMLCEADYPAQELRTLAYLSGSARLMDDCRSGDPHMACAIRAGKVPSWATDKTHPLERQACKAINFGMIYGKSVRTLAEDLDCSTGYARLFVQSFHNSYPEVEPWLQSVIWRARREQSIRTLFNWNMGVGAGTSYRALRNFNMQANCAEMFR